MIKKLKSPFVYLETKFIEKKARYYGRDDIYFKMRCEAMARYGLRLGEYFPNVDSGVGMIGLFRYGLEYKMGKYNIPIEKSVAGTISHEIIHDVLFKEHGRETSIMFDNIAEKLGVEYGCW